MFAPARCEAAVDLLEEPLEINGALMSPKEFSQKMRDDYERLYCLPDDRARSEPPDDRSIDSALAVMSRLNLKCFTPSRIIPSAEGGVGLCFALNGKYADFECFNDGAVLAAITDRRDLVEVFEVNPASHQEIDHAISRMQHFLGQTASAVSPVC